MGKVIKIPPWRLPYPGNAPILDRLASVTVLHPEDTDA